MFDAFEFDPEDRSNPLERDIDPPMRGVRSEVIAPVSFEPISGLLDRFADHARRLGC